MSIERVRAYLASKGMADRIIEPEASSATVVLAAEALGTTPGHIAKTMSFYVDDAPVLVLAAGDVKVDNKKFKETFHKKAKMIPPAEVEEAVGHAPGGVCPFVVKEGVKVWLDRSLQKYDVVYPAAGNDHSGVRLTPEELYELAAAAGWVDVCKEMEQ